MSTFNYTALDKLGKKKKGVLSAQSEREARKFIKDLNFTPITVTQSEGIRGIKSKFKNKDIVIMTRQIATSSRGKYVHHRCFKNYCRSDK